MNPPTGDMYVSSMPGSPSSADLSYPMYNRRPQLQPLSMYFSNGEEKMSNPSPHSASPIGISDASRDLTPDGMLAGNTVWMTPPTSQPRRSPALAYQNASCCTGDECSRPSHPWHPVSSEDSLSRPASASQDCLPLNAPQGGHWIRKPNQDERDFPPVSGGSAVGQTYGPDEPVPGTDLRMSSSMPDLSSYGDYSTIKSEAPSFHSDYPAPSSRSSLMSAFPSPVPSPHMTQRGRPEHMQAHRKGRASSSPRPNMRSVPYDLEESRSQRWSPGPHGPAASKRQGPFIPGGSHAIYEVPQRLPGQSPPTSFAPLPHPANIGDPRPPFMMPPQSMWHGNSMLLPPQIPPQMPNPGFHPDARHFDHPGALPSQGLFRMLQSNGEPHTLHGHYTDLSEPPDLFAALQEEQIPPPEEDMRPADREMIPYEQELRFEGDLYTPRWVRGHGNKREGWCGICKPGRWLVLKNSAFWYDKSFTHGISAATGSPFQEPLETRRMDGNPDVWEGLCGSCKNWVALVSSKKKGTTWFRHAYKCHSHPKVKESTKRRRDNSQSSSVAPYGSKMKAEAQRSNTPLSRSSPLNMGPLRTPIAAPMAQMQTQAGILKQDPTAPTADPMRLPNGRPPSSLPCSTNGLPILV